MADDPTCDLGTLLVADGLDKVYGEGDAATHALKEMSFQFCEGEFAAIIGQSGSGKSTLLNLLGLLDTPTRGSAIYHGTDTTKISKLERASLRAELIGFVFQFHYLLPEFSVYENVAMPALIGGKMSADEIQVACRGDADACSASRAWARRTRTRSPAVRSSASPSRGRS